MENLGTLFPLLKEAYLSSKNLYETKNGSWYGSIQTLFKCIHGIKEQHESSKFAFKGMSKQKIKAYFFKEWGKQMNISSTGKLETYSYFKQNFGLENYLLLVRNFEQRRILTRFRVSAHKLRIESARYQGTLRQDRICLKCTSNEIEDEKHFLFVCSKFILERESLFINIIKTCKNFGSLANKDKLIWLMTTENVEVLICLSEYTLKT